MQPSSAGRITHCSLLSVCPSDPRTKTSRNPKLEAHICLWLVGLAVTSSWTRWWRGTWHRNQSSWCCCPTRMLSRTCRHCAPALPTKANKHRVNDTNEQTNKQKHSAQCDTQERNSVQNMLNVWRVNLWCRRVRKKLNWGEGESPWGGRSCTCPLHFCSRAFPRTSCYTRSSLQAYES